MEAADRSLPLRQPGPAPVLEALYGACVVEGCEVPSWMCEIHHTEGWKLGAATDIDKQSGDERVVDLGGRVEAIRE